MKKKSPTFADLVNTPMKVTSKGSLPITEAIKEVKAKQSKHTPGPWKCVALEPDNSTNWARFQIQHWPDEEHRQEREAIADVLYAFGERKVFEHAGANARLIAAAPELLEAAIHQHEAIDFLCARLIELDPKFLPSKCGEVWEALQKGNTAIAKAEGK